MLSSAIITPSFRGDLDRCELLSESVQRWVSPDVPHYVVVDRRDEKLFAGIARSPRTRLLIVEDIIPWWIFRVPGLPKVWGSLASMPVRNWILQQIVKVSIAGHITEDVMLFVDSDTFFCREYDPRKEQRDGRAPLFMQTGQRGLIPLNDKWHRTAANLLGLAPEETYDTNFIGNNICWRRDLALKMQERIAEVAGKSFTRALAGTLAFSEYIAYGMFVTGLVELEQFHWVDEHEHTLTHWDPTPLDRAELVQLKNRLTDDLYSVMISAKSKTPISLIREVFL